MSSARANGRLFPSLVGPREKSDNASPVCPYFGLSSILTAHPRLADVGESRSSGEAI
jgi:hypothetical protein